jgi:serine/threonine protein kinase
MLVYILLVALTPTFADAMRVKQQKSTANTSVAAEGQAQAGMMLRDRYRLEKFLERRTKGGATPGVSFPYISSSRRQFNSSAEHLGQGSFGDVWKAHDTTLGKTVAIKIFYQGSQYMTWRNADDRGRQELSESSEECRLVKNILRPENRNLYPIGASRICECYDEYISDSKGTSNVVFLVQEMCGSSLSTAIIGARRKSQRMNYYKARQATKQMLQAIAFLQMFDPPLIHHDLKPGNVCINDKEEIKVIDWGGTMFGKTSNMLEPAVATPLFTPPEVASGLQSFAAPWWSYDDYALGLMHMMFLCPFVEDLDWYYSRPVTKSVMLRVVKARCGPDIDRTIGHYSDGETFDDDLDLIDRLTSSNPTRRPDPMKLLDHASMANIPTPALSEERAVELLNFKVGDGIEYWSESYGEWLPGRIKAVDQRRGTYDLVHPDGAFLKNGADPGRVRKQQDLRATVDESFKVSIGNRHIRDANGIKGGGIIEPVGHWRDGRVEVARAVGDTLPLSILFSVEQPTVRRTSRRTLEVNAFIRCDTGVTCDIESVNMHCRKGYGLDKVEADYPMRLRQFGHMPQALVDVRGNDPLVGAGCEVEAVATVRNGPLPGDNGRHRSLKKYITLQEAYGYNF